MDKTENNAGQTKPQPTNADLSQNKQVIAQDRAGSSEQVKAATVIRTGQCRTLVRDWGAVSAIEATTTVLGE